MVHAKKKKKKKKKKKDSIEISTESTQAAMQYKCFNIEQHQNTEPTAVIALSHTYFSVTEKINYECSVFESSLFLSYLYECLSLDEAVGLYTLHVFFAEYMLLCWSRWIQKLIFDIEIRS